MRLAALAKLHPLDWVSIIVPIARLIGDVVSALQDGRLDEAEITRIGGELVAIVATVAGKAA